VSDMLAEVGSLLLRTFVLYLVTLVIMRMMGKRSVGNLAPFDLAVIIIIGSTAALPMEEDRIHLIRGVVPIVFLGILQVGLSYANLHSPRLERLTQGTSTLLVRDGGPIVENLRRERFTLEDLSIVLREGGVADIQEVQELRIEPTGRISIIKNPAHRPLTPSDLGMLLLTEMERLQIRTDRDIMEQVGRVLREARGGVE